jgi:branched-chain amino acid transport system substrate-binding protein
MMPVMVPVVTNGKVISLAYTMSVARIGADRPYCFGVLSDYKYMIPLHVKALKNKYPQIKTFGHLQANDESGHANTPYITNACKANEIEIFSEVFERNQQDYYPLLTRLLARKPDCIGAVWTDGEAGMIIKQARQMGYKGVFYDINPHDVATIMKLAGAESAEGFMFPALPTEGPGSPPGLAEIRQKYIDKFTSTAGIDLGLQIYDHLGMLAAAIEKAGTLDTDQVKAGLETLRYKGLRGDMRFGGSKLYGISHQIAQPEFLCQIKNGKLVGLAVVTPEDILKIIGE